MRTERECKTCDKMPGRRPGTALIHRADSFPLTHLLLIHSHSGFSTLAHSI
jgi:hypothetical protein